MSSPMYPLVEVKRRGAAPKGISQGSPRFALYWASRKWFVYPGLHVWTGRRDLRILPLRKSAR